MTGTVLEAEESQYLEAQRGWLKAHFPDNPAGRYATVEGKIDLIERILANGWITEGEKRQYQPSAWALAIRWRRNWVWSG